MLCFFSYLHLPALRNCLILGAPMLTSPNQLLRLHVAYVDPWMDPLFTSNQWCQGSLPFLPAASHPLLVHRKWSPAPTHKIALEKVESTEISPVPKWNASSTATLVFISTPCCCAKPAKVSLTLFQPARRGKVNKFIKGGRLHLGCWDCGKLYTPVAAAQTI